MSDESSQGIRKWHHAVGTESLVLLGCAMFVLLSGAFGLGSTASAAPPVLWERCQSGSEAGQCRNPRGAAADRENGHVFVGDQFNRRIVELNALGEFIKAWGWGVDTGAAELETCTEASGCQAGLAGAGIGQLSAPLGLAVDSNSDVYVVDFSNSRVQKFDSEGNFVLMIGGEVNETSGGNVCPRPGFPADVCKAAPAASGGGGPGEFGSWGIGDFIAITPTDKVYVGDQGRIQRLDVEGVYQDECEVPGTVQSLATDAADNLYAAYSNQLGVHKLAYATPECEETAVFEFPKLGEAEPFPSAVAVDFDANVYAFGPTNPARPTDPICKFAPDGSVSECFGKEEFNGSTGLETNLCAESEEPGNLYVSNFSIENAFVRAYGTEPIGCFRARTLPATKVEETSATLNGTVNPKGEAVTECFFEYGETTAYDQEAACEDPNAAEIGTGSVPVPVHADISGLGPGTVYHFRLLARIGGELETGADEVFKTLGPPVITEEHVVGATDTAATLKALVNPEGFATSCHFDYGLSESYGQSTDETPVGSDRSDHAVSATLEGLAPGTTYHWRVVCENASDTSASEDHTLNTYRTFVEGTDCPNQALRGGPSAQLPDCRAYEMVSPVDKNGGDIVSSLGDASDPGGFMQASLDGDKVTYTSLASFGDQPSNVGFNQYLAERGGDDWSTQGIHPPVSGKTGEGAGLHREFMAFSADLCSAWLVDEQNPPVTEEAQPGYFNLYRRDNCEPGTGELETLTTVEPPEGTAPNYVGRYSVQGTSTDSRHAFFVAKAALTANAATGGNDQIYDRFGGELHLVSVRPDGSAATGPKGVGSGWDANLQGAVSEDGSRIYWTADGSSPLSGTIYLRENPEQPQSALAGEECLEAGKACTIPVSEGSSALFWAASPDGARALYSEGGNLFRFDRESETSEPIAEDVSGVSGVSEDLSRIYFVSDKALPESGQNSEGDEAVEGQPNLYLAEGGGLSFIATVSEGDLGALEPGTTSGAYSIAAQLTYLRPTRVSPDGGTIAFQARAALSDYDNTDVGSGRPAVEVYLHQADADELICVSCNPSGARPSGRELNEPYHGTHVTDVFAAAWIPTWEHPNRASHVLSADGGRLFFNSNDALLPRDGNGAQDVYQWEAPGVGGCSEASSSYFPQNGGCLDLVSSGQSPFESEFWEASPEGDDVFFTTASSLVPSDPGLVDLYDARVGGGFPLPVVGKPCEGEACQSPPPPPEFGAPASGTYRGPGNVSEGKARKRCPKGKRKVRRAGKVKCVKKRCPKGKRKVRRAGNVKCVKHKKHRRRAGQSRRAGR